MKRVLLLLALTVAAGGAVTVAYFSPLFAAPPESEELVAPTATPDIIAPDVPTVVTFTATVTDPDIRRLKLQFFNPAKQKWKTVGRLRDDGQFGDQTSGDGTFTIQVEILDSNGRAQLTVLGKRAKEKGNVPSPGLFRLVGKRKGQRGKVVSPSVTRGVWLRTTIPGSELEVSYPPSLAIEGNELSPQTTFVGSDGTNFAIVITPTDSTVESTVEWADQEEWAFFDDWRNHFEVISVAGFDALRDPQSGSVVFKVGPQIYHITNGITGPSSPELDAQSFATIIESLSVPPPP